MSNVMTDYKCILAFIKLRFRGIVENSSALGARKTRVFLSLTETYVSVRWCANGPGSLSCVANSQGQIATTDMLVS